MHLRFRAEKTGTYLDDLEELPENLICVHSCCPHCGLVCTLQMGQFLNVAGELGDHFGDRQPHTYRLHALQSYLPTQTQFDGSKPCTYLFYYCDPDLRYSQILVFIVSERCEKESYAQGYR